MLANGEEVGAESDPGTIYSHQQEPVRGGAAVEGIRLCALPVSAPAPAWHHPELPGVGSGAVLPLHLPAAPAFLHAHAPINACCHHAPTVFLHPEEGALTSSQGTRLGTEADAGLAGRPQLGQG